VHNVLTISAMPQLVTIELTIFNFTFSNLVLHI